MGSILCEHCAAACCRYLALPIDPPSGQRDYDDLRWYLMHEGVSIFVEEGDWYVQWQTRCKNLGENNLCMVYETRPEICRDYEPGACDYTSGSHGYDHLFTHAKQIEELYYSKTGRQLGAVKRGASPRRGKTGKKKKRAVMA